MPVSVSVSSLEWVRLVVFSGTVTDRDLVQAYDATARCLLDPSMDLLVDATAVERIAATPEALRTIASRRAAELLRSGSALPRVAVVAADARMFGFARMYEAIRESASGAARCFACRTIDEARCWLGLSDGPSDAPLALALA